MDHLIIVLVQLLAMSVGIAPSPEADQAVPPSLVSLNPAVSFAGGSDVERDVVTDAVGRFVDNNLRLPDLHVRIHDDTSGCNGKQGLFRREGSVGVVDLCFSREFLALHELAHAWEQFTLDDVARADFLVASGFETWNSRDVPWSRRGMERAADSIAHGLLSVPPAPNQDLTREFGRFETLTGLQPPRSVVS